MSVLHSPTLLFMLNFNILVPEISNYSYPHLHKYKHSLNALEFLVMVYINGYWYLIPILAFSKLAYRNLSKQAKHLSVFMNNELFSS